MCSFIDGYNEALLGDDMKVWQRWREWQREKEGIIHIMAVLSWGREGKTGNKRQANRQRGEVENATVQLEWETARENMIKGERDKEG